MNTCNDTNEIVRDITAHRNALRAEACRAKSAAMQACDYDRRTTTTQPEPVSPAVSLARMAMVVIVALGVIALAMNAFVAWVSL